MAADGKTVAALAAEIGETAPNVYKVLSGRRAASTGAGHRIAVKLGLKGTTTSTALSVADSDQEIAR